MWNLLNQRKELEKEVYAKLRPGDLYGDEQQSKWAPEALLRYLLLAAASMLTFFGIMLFNVGAEATAHQEFYASVWLLGVGVAIAGGSWALFQLSRAGEARAVAREGNKAKAEDLSPAVRSVMKRAAIMKLLAFRVMIVAGISCCVGLYTGLKGLVIL